MGKQTFNVITELLVTLILRYTWFTTDDILESIKCSKRLSAMKKNRSGNGDWKSGERTVTTFSRVLGVDFAKKVIFK